MLGAGGGAVTSQDVVFLGGSALFLPQLRLTAPSGNPSFALTHERNISNVSSSTTDSEADSELGEVAGSPMIKVVASQDFELSYVPLKRGFATFGGLRAMLVEDRVTSEDGDDVPGSSLATAEPRVLKEWEVVGEVWVEC